MGRKSSRLPCDREAAAKCARRQVREKRREQHVKDAIESCTDWKTEDNKTAQRVAREPKTETGKEVGNVRDNAPDDQSRHRREATERPSERKGCGGMRG